ncbi:hypothetical protein Poly30_46310 [Planctomycetes bacterium Poly30]|uniref:Uncharacterized protein n=1 Tax=Saltatorellus ferox TaxID=2528018 RepID=A0A518EYA9_9BACT|nr:hypothetical protein Poly30_46310 [Planctomycetes bacterium Poly30]
MCSVSAQTGGAHSKPVTAHSPSRAYYFDWINSQYEGSTEAHTLVNLEFFRWMHDEYGMELDVYLLDVGNIDDGPYTAGVGRLIPDHYGSLQSESFLEQFPRGFGPLSERAAQFGCRLGIWLGPDGFGETPEKERIRSEMYVSLCRDHAFAMFKLDSVAGGLRPGKLDVLLETLAKCREYVPDLLVLNERVELLENREGVSTSLWEGVETYIDVFSWNETTAPHHRAGALARPYPPSLRRDIEDHGVCLSSCLERWDDDLVLQTFNRGTILGPEIYGSPWFLRDEEFPKLARLCNLYRLHGEILVDAIGLPEERFGPHAVSRGDERTRFLTLRNLTWEPVTYSIPLDETIGISGGGPLHVYQYHPTDWTADPSSYEGVFEVTVDPFRVCLVAVSAEPLGSMAPAGAEVPATTLKEPWHRHLVTLLPAEVPADAEALYEATCFAADNNALEIRSLERSGPTAIPEVAAARAAFLDQPMFVNRAIWDRQLFDGKLDTFFRARREGGAFRLDLGEALPLDRLVIRTMGREAHDDHLESNRWAEDSVAEYSDDLKSWTEVDVPGGVGTIAVLHFPEGARVRYLRIQGAPRRLAEIYGYVDGSRTSCDLWRASNLFTPYSANPAVAAWTGSFILEELAPRSFLAVAIEGQHGNEGAWAALRLDGQLVGAPDRAVSFPSNTWEYQNVEMDHGYTYLFPLTPDVIGKTIEVVVLSLKGGGTDLSPEVWLTAHESPLGTSSIRTSNAPRTSEK